MRLSIRSIAIALSLIMMAALSSVVKAQSQDEEWAFSFTEGEEPQFIPHYGMYTTDCSISPATDIDTFEFYGEEGDWIHISVDGRANDVDCAIELRGPYGDLLNSKNCTADYYHSCSVAMALELEDSGVHTVLIYDAGYNNPGGFYIHLEQMPPDYHASALSYNAAVRGWSSPTSDVDFYKLEGRSGDIIRFTLDGRSNDFDPRMRLLSADGSEVWDAYCNADYYHSCSVSREYEFAESGTYFLMVNDNGFDNPGEYDLTLQCIFGDCPQTFKIESDPRPLVAGEDVTLTASYGQPRTPTFLGYSIKGVGETPVPPLNVTLKLDRPYQIGGAKRADDNGTAIWTLPVPGNVAGFYVWLQAAQPNATTNVMRTHVQ